MDLRGLQPEPHHADSRHRGGVVGLCGLCACRGGHVGRASQVSFLNLSDQSWALALP